MSYVEERPHGPALRVAQIAAAVVIGIAVIFVPYALAVGGFWGADLGLLLVHIVEISVIPVAAIPISFAKARSLAEDDRSRLAALVRFLPILLQLGVGPLLMLATSQAWWAPS